MSKPTQEDIDLAKATERQLDLPEGALVGFVAEGGKLDGKRRAKVLESYGIDAKQSRRNTIEATGLALQDALSDNAGDASKAIAELHSGADRAKWNKATTTFASRALGTRAADGSYLGNRPVAPAAAPQMTGQRSASGTSMTRPVGNRSASGMTDPRGPVQAAPPPPSTDYGTEQSIAPDQTMAALDAAQPVTSVDPAVAPVAAAPAPLSTTSLNPAAAGEMEGARAAPAGLLAAYRDGRMPEAERVEVDRLVKTGALTVPADFQLNAAPQPTQLDRVISAPSRALDAVGNAITGNDRATAETRAAADWSQIPEWEDVPTLPNVAALLASPKEALQVLASHAPGVTTRTDEKGNLWAFSPKAGKEFVVTPGASLSDAPRFGANALLALASGGGSVAAQVGKSAATQALIESGQAASGGTFDGGDVLLAGAAPLAAPILGAAARGGRGAANALLDAIPGSTTRQLAGAATDAASTIVDDPAAAAVRAAAAPVEDVTKVVPPPVGAVDDVTKVVPPPASAAPAAVESAAAPISEAVEKEVGQGIADLIRAASGTGPAAKAAQVELAKAFEVSPVALKAAERLGVLDGLPVDVLANNVQLKNTVGSMRAKVGTKAEADFAKATGDTVAKLDEVLKDLGAEASPAGFSDRVLDRFKEVQEGLKTAAKEAYAPVNKAVKPSDNVTLDNLAAIVAQRKKDMGGALKGIDAEMAAIVERAKVMPDAKTKDGVLRSTFGVIKGEKAQIRKALERMESTYGSADENVLKEYQRALVADELANVERIGGAELAEKARLANQLWAQKKEVDEKIVSAFGKKESGDVSRLMLAAITDASKGSVGKLNKLLEVLPPEMHGEALMTAIGSLTRAKGGAAASAESFGAAEFVQVFRGLRAKGNEGIYKQIEKAIGPKRADVLRDVYEISRRITDAKAAIKGTGKDAQNVMENLAAENLMGSLLGSPVGKQAVRGAGAVAGAAVGGLPGAGIGGAAADYIMSRIAVGGEEQIVKAGAVMMSPEFKALAVNGLASNPVPKKEAVRALVSSAPFRAWAKAAMLPREPKALEQWVMAAIQGARGPTTEAVTREAR